MYEEMEANRQFLQKNIIKEDVKLEKYYEDNVKDFLAEQTDVITQSFKHNPGPLIDLFQQSIVMDYYVKNYVRGKDQCFEMNSTSQQENENEKFVNPKCVCRLCAKTDQTIFMRLFDANKTMTPIASKIAYLMGKDKVEQDVLPQQICLGCSEMVDSSYNALQQFSESHQTLSDIAAFVMDTMDIPGICKSKNKDIKLENESKNIENDDDFSIENDDFTIENYETDLNQPLLLDSGGPLTGIRKKRIVDQHYLQMLKEPLVELMSCNYCGRVFQSTFNDEFIKSHILVHLCSPLESDLKQDININTLDIGEHVGTTSCYVCSFCKVPKVSPATLKTHLNSCCSTFAKRYNLKIAPRRLYRDRNHTKSHYCKTCNDGIPFKRTDFKVHMKENHPNLILNCFHCSNVFFERRPLQAHINSRHLRKTSTDEGTHQQTNSTKKVQKKRNTPVLCEHCSLQCSSRSGYANHLRKVHLNPLANPKRRSSFQPRNCKQEALRNGWEWQYCHECDKTLQFKDGAAGLEFHLLKHKSPNNKVMCCNREYEYYCKYKNHVQSHTKTWVCKICGETCASMVLLQDHLTTSHTRKNYCEACSYKAQSSRNYIHHMKAVHSVINANCPLCGQVCETKRDLHFHQRQFHWKEFFKQKEGDLPDPIFCCGKKFVKGMNLKRHTAKHKDTPCKTCGDVLKSKLALLSHNASHHRTKGVNCTYCGKTYTNSDNLKYHMLKHTHGRQVKCVCGLSFYTETDMRRHQRMRKRPCKDFNVVENKNVQIVVVGADMMEWSDEEG